jgi:hypothetical protein
MWILCPGLNIFHYQVQLCTCHFSWKCPAQHLLCRAFLTCRPRRQELIATARLFQWLISQSQHIYTTTPSFFHELSNQLSKRAIEVPVSLPPAILSSANTSNSPTHHSSTTPPDHILYKYACNPHRHTHNTLHQPTVANSHVSSEFKRKLHLSTLTSR